LRSLESIQLDILTFLKSRAGVTVPSPETDLVETGVLDSLVLIDLLLFLEEEYGVRLPVDRLELDQVRSVARVSSLIEQNGKGIAPR
jgi:acyl carrier protein